MSYGSSASRKLARAGLALMVAACSGTEPTVIGATIASPNPAHLDQPVTITVVVTNVSGRTLSLPAPASAPCVHFFDIVDGAGRRAQLMTMLCVAVALPPVEVRSGESVEYTESWTPSTATIAGAPLGPGDYEVRPANLEQVRFGSRSSVMLQLID